MTPPPDITTGDPADDKLDARVFKIAGVVVLGAIMSILDVTVVTVAIPTFQTIFDTTYAIAAWTMTGYTLALATVIPLTGWAADRFGTKRLYMAALVFFVLGSVLCATAWNIGSLIGFRVIQGLGGGMLMPLGMTIMTHAAGPHRIGRVMAVLGVPMLLGPIAGPILGGWLIDSFSWHWIFLINLPIGIVALIYAWIVLPADQPEPSESFDFLGMLLASPGLALFLYGVSSIPEAGTVAARKVLIPMIIGAILLVVFVFHALRAVHPLIDLRLFKNSSLRYAVITMTLFAMAFFGSGLLLPSYLQQVRGESTLMAGLLIAPQGLGAMLTMPIAGRLVDKIGPGKIVLTGIAVMSIGMAYLTQVTADTPYPLLLGALFVMGLGMGCTMMPTMTAAIQTLTHAQVARGSTLMNIVNLAAGVLVGEAAAQQVQHEIRADAAVGRTDEGAAHGAHQGGAAAGLVGENAFGRLDVGIDDAGAHIGEDDIAGVDGQETQQGGGVDEREQIVEFEVEFVGDLGQIGAPGAAPHQLQQTRDAADGGVGQRGRERGGRIRGGDGLGGVAAGEQAVDVIDQGGETGGAAIARARLIDGDLGDDVAGIGAQHHHPVGQKHRLLDVVGDDTDAFGGEIGGGPQVHQFGAQVLRGQHVQRGEGFVHEQQIRFQHQGARETHALAHTAGQLLGVGGFETV